MMSFTFLTHSIKTALKVELDPTANDKFCMYMNVVVFDGISIMWFDSYDKSYAVFYMFNNWTASLDGGDSEEGGKRELTWILIDWKFSWLIYTSSCSLGAQCGPECHWRTDQSSSLSTEPLGECCILNFTNLILLASACCWFGILTC